LFGGAVRDRVPYYWYVPAGDDNEMARSALEGVERGFETFYMKVGFDEGGSARHVRLVREAIGADRRLRVDANESWRTGQAVQAIRELEPLDLEFVEQPVNMYDIEALAEVQARVSVPIAANQTTWDEYATLAVLRRGAASVVVTDPHQVGGLGRFRKVAAMCEIANVPVVKHSFGDLGVTTLATAHVLATCSNAELAHQTHYQILEGDVIVGGPPVFSEGTIGLPEGAGIGVDLDSELVGEYAETYRRDGEFTAYEARAQSP
jgi:glucarate dehydratase